jgi:hypothetical protein
MSITINKWRVVVTSDNSHGFVWRDEDQGLPTVGPNGEAITTSLSRIVEVRDPNEVRIQEENTPSAGGHYSFHSEKLVAAANTITTLDMSFPFDINILASKVHITADMEGDILSWSVSPNTTAGTITSDVNINDTVINVSQTVIDNVDIGYHIRLADAGDPDGTNEELHRVIAKDEVANTITVEVPATQAWLASGPTLVQINIYYLWNVEIGPGVHNIEPGKSKIGAAHLPANTIIRAIYDNKHATDTKIIVTYIEYLY